MASSSFTFEYRPGTIHCGPGVVGDLGSALDSHGCSRALVVTGSTVGASPAVMDPVRDGLGDRLVGVFDGVTAEKYLRTACEAARRVREEDVDALVGVGGGSSLDTARVAAVLAGHDRPLDDVAAEVVAREEMLVPEGDLPALVAVPTTLPGADLTQVAGVKLATDPAGVPASAVPSGGVSDARLMPTALCYDRELFATTPAAVLATSAMNGYDKAIELLYSRHRTPITDATAVRALGLLQPALPALRADPIPGDDLGRVVRGILLAQYGLSTPRVYRASVIHAFGHAIARRYDVQQGAAHAIAAPHVLAFLFSAVDGRRRLLADALGVQAEGTGDEEVASSVVDAVTATRDGLELPSRLGAVDGVERAHVPDLARAVLADPFMTAAPEGLDPGQEGIEAVFEAMW